MSRHRSTHSNLITKNTSQDRRVRTHFAIRKNTRQMWHSFSCWSSVLNHAAGSVNYLIWLQTEFKNKRINVDTRQSTARRFLSLKFLIFETPECRLHAALAHLQKSTKSLAERADDCGSCALQRWSSVNEQATANTQHTQCQLQCQCVNLYGASRANPPMRWVR